MDQQRLGMPTWCEDQKSRLAGFIRAKSEPAKSDAGQNEPAKNEPAKN
jgi:hypothetical protein